MTREDALSTIRLLHAFYRSDEAGGWVDVGSDDATDHLGSAASEARRQVVPQAQRECEHRASDNRRHDEGQHNTENRYEGLAAEVRGSIKDNVKDSLDFENNRPCLKRGMGGNGVVWLPW